MLSGKVLVDRSILKSDYNQCTPQSYFTANTPKERYSRGIARKCLLLSLKHLIREKGVKGNKH